VIDQSYPNIEYIVIDGGSSDGSFLSVWLVRRIAARRSPKPQLLRSGISAFETIWIQPAAGRQVLRQRPDIDLIHGRCRIIHEHGAKMGARTGAIRLYEEILDLWEVWWKEGNICINEPDGRQPRLITRLAPLLAPKLGHAPSL
jgi:hypothetical protein